LKSSESYIFVLLFYEMKALPKSKQFRKLTIACLVHNLDRSL